MKPISIQTLLLSVLLMLCINAQAGVEITYIHNDALGSPVAGTDEQGDVRWRSYYQPFGEEMLGERELQEESTGYAGHREDANTGLVYMGARFYSPTLGRFMGVDPAGVNEANIHSFNRYAYANNNPYKYVDPDGRESIEAAEIRRSRAQFFSPFKSAGEIGSSVADAIDPVESPENLAPVGVGAKLLGIGVMGSVKFGKRAREIGKRAKIDDDALLQIEEIEKAQRNFRKGKGSKRIDNIDKSKQRAQHQLDRMTIEDATDIDN